MQAIPRSARIRGAAPPTPGGAAFFPMPRLLILVVLLGILPGIPPSALAGWQGFTAGGNGLVDERVRVIHEDPEGRIWFGTRSGLSRFDGLTWRTWRADLPDEDVVALADDPAGGLWVGTFRGGVTRFDGTSWTPLPPGCLPTTPSLQDLLLDSAGVLWMATPFGVYAYDPATGDCRTFTAADGLLADNATALAEDPDGSLWVGSPEGLTRIDPTRTLLTPETLVGGSAAGDSVLVLATLQGAVWAGTGDGAWCRAGGGWVRYGPEDGLPDRRVRSLADGGSEVLVGTFRGLAAYRPSTGTWRTRPANPEGKPVTVEAILRDTVGNLWLAWCERDVTATDSGVCLDTGVHRFDADTWERFVSPDLTCNPFLDLPADTVSVLPSNCVTGLLEDHAGELWVTTLDNGATRLDRTGRWRPVTSFRLPRELTLVAEDQAGYLWFGSSADGVARLDPGRTQWSNYLAPDLPPGAVTAFHQDRSGDFWIGTEGGLARLHSPAWTRYFDGVGPGPAAAVRDVAEDAGRNLWAVTDAGLHVIPPDRSAPTAVDTVDGLPTAGATRLFVASDGTLWLATPAGAARLAGGAWTAFPELVPGQSPETFCFHEAPDGAVWVGSRGGASRFDGTWLHLSATELGAAQIVAIQVDAAGTVWFSARNQGVVRWNGTGFRRYRAGDQLASGWTPDILEDGHGDLWFTSLDAGLARHRPDRTAPQTLLLDHPPAVSVSRSANFTFGAAYGEAGDLLFSGALDGLPVFTGVETSSHEITGLPDGDHGFVVSARDWAGNVDPTPAAWPFLVDATGPTAVIASPAFDAPVRGEVTVRGTTLDPRFVSSMVDVRPRGVAWDDPSVSLLASSDTPVENGALAVWSTLDRPDGRYEIRLRVLDDLGLSGQDVVQVLVDNEAPFAEVTAPVAVTAAAGGDVFSTRGEVRVFVPPRGFDRDVVVDIREESDSSFTVDWTGGSLVKTATLTWRTGGETDPVIHRRKDSAWIPLGGTPTSDGEAVESPLREPGTYALLDGPATTPVAPPLGAISMTPRVLSASTGGSLAIGFTLGAAGPVRVMIYNRAGRPVRVVHTGSLAAGANLVRWDGRNESGDLAPDGLYLVTIEAADTLERRSIAVAR